MAGCGRLRWNVACIGLSAVTSSTLKYQSLRGFLRNLFCDLPISMSKVHFTSAEVNGLPSCHFTPSRNWNIKDFLSSLHFQLVASSGVRLSTLFCALCWSNTTRLLKIGIEETLTV